MDALDEWEEKDRRAIGWRCGSRPNHSSWTWKSLKLLMARGQNTVLLRHLGTGQREQAMAGCKYGGVACVEPSRIRPPLTEPSSNTTSIPPATLNPPGPQLLGSRSSSAASPPDRNRAAANTVEHRSLLADSQPIRGNLSAASGRSR